MNKIPYLLIVGDKEIENNTISVRARGGEDLGEMSLDDFKVMVLEKVHTKQ
jgi:threonyl-tRNA synthetase